MTSNQKNIALDPQEVLKRAQRTLVESTDVQAGKSKFAAKIDSAESRRTTDEAYFMKSVSGRVSPAAGVRASGDLSTLAERFADATSGSLRLLAEAASQGVGLMLNYDAATKESWVINKNRINELEYALSEFQGIIIGVFKINNWYAAATENNKINRRWGFDGEDAPKDIKDIYLNKSIAHVKKKGAANPIRYNL